MNYNEISSSSNGSYNVASLGLSIGVLIAIFAFLFFCWLVVSVIRMPIFKKAGRSSWFAFVPFYSSYILCDIALGIEWFSLLYCLCPLPFLGLTGNYKGLSVILSFAMFVMNVVLDVNLSKRFGKGVGFAIGLIILPVVFYPILAFDKSKYIPIAQEQNSDNSPNLEQNQTKNKYNEISDYAQEEEINLSHKNNDNEN